MITYLSFLSVFLIYPLVKLITKNNFNKNQMMPMFFYLFIIGLSIHYDRYPNMQIQTIIAALCYPFMGYLALNQSENRVNK